MAYIKDLSVVITSEYNDADWACVNDDYDRLEWYSKDIDKPTYEECKQKSEELENA
tara:strand:- start:244 stop:411 length:168 start_codon:yes stop_codon:yes gene_type:complete